MSTKIKRYAVLTPFDKPEVVAGILALQRIDASVVPTQSGALVVRELPVPQYDEWDIRNIVGPDEDEDVDASDNAPSVAAILSRLSKFGVVLIDVDLGSDVGIEAGVSGIVRARRFLGGKPGQEVSSGLLLNSVDPLIEKIVLGHENPADHGAIASSEVTTSMITRLATRSRGRGSGGGKDGVAAGDGGAEGNASAAAGDGAAAGDASEAGAADAGVSEAGSAGDSAGQVSSQAGAEDGTQAEVSSSQSAEASQSGSSQTADSGVTEPEQGAAEGEEGSTGEKK